MAQKSLSKVTRERTIFEGGTDPINIWSKGKKRDDAPTGKPEESGAWGGAATPASSREEDSIVYSRRRRSQPKPAAG